MTGMEITNLMVIVVQGGTAPGVRMIACQQDITVLWVITAPWEVRHHYDVPLDHTKTNSANQIVKDVQRDISVTT